MTVPPKTYYADHISCTPFHWLQSLELVEGRKLKFPLKNIPFTIPHQLGHFMEHVVGRYVEI
jgi:hypothetical protein